VKSVTQRAKPMNASSAGSVGAEEFWSAIYVSYAHSIKIKFQAYSANLHLRFLLQISEKVQNINYAAMLLLVQAREVLWPSNKSETQKHHLASQAGSFCGLLSHNNCLSSIHDSSNL